MSANGIEHITVSPYHPSSNGLAERAVQIFKQAMVKISHGCLREKVCRFLTKYRATPHSTTGVSPSELILGRKMTTHLDLLHPLIESHVIKRQKNQKSQHDKTSNDREIGVNDNVFVRNYNNKQKWIPGIVTQQTGPLSYRINTPSLGTVRRHQDQIRVTSCDLTGSQIHNTPETESENNKFSSTQLDAGIDQHREVDEEMKQNHKTYIDNEDTVLLDTYKSGIDRPIDTSTVTSSSEQNVVVPLRRSARQSKPPDRFSF